MKEACFVPLTGAVARVRDTGWQRIASDLCARRRLMVGSPPSADWGAVQRAAQAVQAWGRTLAEQIAAVNNDIRQLNRHRARLNDALLEVQAVIPTMWSHLASMKEHAAVRPMTPYQACQTIRYDLEQTLRYDLEQSLTCHRDRFAAVAKELETALGMVENRLTQTREVARALETALAASPHLRLNPNVAPSDAEQAIAALVSTADAAREDLSAQRAADHEAVRAANAIIAEGKTVFETARVLANC